MIKIMTFRLDLIIIRSSNPKQIKFYTRTRETALENKIINDDWSLFFIALYAILSIKLS